MPTVLVTGATGFVGRRLVPALLEAGHTVRAMTRNPDGLRRPGRARARRRRTTPGRWPTRSTASTSRSTSCTRSTTTTSSARTPRPPRGVRAGRRRPPASARSSTSAGSAPMTASCRRTCGRGARWRGCWARRGVPVTVLRAAIVVGAGGISWEITRQLVKNLPAMVVPKWASTLSQPIGVDDVVRLPRRRGRQRGGAGAGLRDRRSRAADLPRHAAAGGRGDARPPAPDRDRAGAHAAAVVALDRVWSPTSTPPPAAT